MSATPIEDAIRMKVVNGPSVLLITCLEAKLISGKITQSLKPTRLEIYNDSSMHAHHQAMKGSVSRETHFRLVIVSGAFLSKTQPARHRMVYSLLKEELETAHGIHALQLRTRTPVEDAKQLELEQDKEAQ